MDARGFQQFEGLDREAAAVDGTIRYTYNGKYAKGEVGRHMGANPKKIATYVHAHTFTVPGYTFRLSWTKWGELAHPRIAFDLLTSGPAPAGTNTGGTWYPKQLSLSNPLTPYRPG